MKAIGKFIHHIDTNHKKGVPAMIMLIIILLATAWFVFPSYEEYCKTATHKCQNK